MPRGIPSYSFTGPIPGSANPLQPGGYKEPAKSEVTIECLEIGLRIQFTCHPTEISSKLYSLQLLLLQAAIGEGQRGQPGWNKSKIADKCDYFMNRVVEHAWRMFIYESFKNRAGWLPRTTKTRDSYIQKGQSIGHNLLRGPNDRIYNAALNAKVSTSPFEKGKMRYTFTPEFNSIDEKKAFATAQFGRNWEWNPKTDNPVTFKAYGAESSKFGLFPTPAGQFGSRRRKPKWRPSFYLRSNHPGVKHRHNIVQPARSFLPSTEEDFEFMLSKMSEIGNTEEIFEKIREVIIQNLSESAQEIALGLIEKKIDDQMNKFEEYYSMTDIPPTEQYEDWVRNPTREYSGRSVRND